MALLKTKDRATMLLPKDNSTIIRPETFKAGFTQSEIGIWDDCAEKWYLSYNHQLRRRGGFEWYFIYGDGVHATLEHWYRTGEEKVATLQLPEDVIPTADTQYELRKWQHILKVQMERYFIYHADDLTAWTPWAVEETVAVEFEGVKFTGKIDLGYQVDGDSANILMDHKTFGMDDYEGWQFRFQFMFYLWLAAKATKKKINRFVVNGIKKPQLRQGKDESLESFGVRIMQDMIQVPDKYFQRHPLPMIAHSMEHFEERVLRPKIERIKLLTQATTPDIVIEALVRNQNTHNCVKYGEMCEFLPICKSGFQREGHWYFQRENKHEELA